MLIFLEVSEAMDEQVETKRAFDTRDRSTIRCSCQYQPIRARALARLACSAAVAGMRLAVYNTPAYDDWLAKHANANALAAERRIARRTRGTGPGRLWDTLQGGWGPPPWYSDDEPWGHLPGDSGWGDSDRWDGTLVPKTPGKAKRRRLRRQKLRAEDFEWRARADEELRRWEWETERFEAYDAGCEAEDVRTWAEDQVKWKEDEKFCC